VRAWRLDQASRAHGRPARRTRFGCPPPRALRADAAGSESAIAELRRRKSVGDIDEHARPDAFSRRSTCGWTSRRRGAVDRTSPARHDNVGRPGPGSVGDDVPFGISGQQPCPPLHSRNARRQLAHREKQVANPERLLQEGPMSMLDGYGPPLHARCEGEGDSLLL
jgi:hypothetical protein